MRPLPTITLEQYGAIAGESARYIQEQFEMCYRSLDTPLPSAVTLALFDTMQRWQDYAAKRRAETGIITAGEEGFLATHDAWQGNPQINVCLERLLAHPALLQQGALHQVAAHSVLHGQAEYYRFMIPEAFVDLSQSRGMDLEILQQLLYFVALAIKGHEAVQFLVSHGFIQDQVALALYQLEANEDDTLLWEMARWDVRARFLYLAALLRPLLYTRPLLDHAPNLEQAGRLRLSHLPLEESKRLGRLVDTLAVRRRGDTHHDVTIALGLLLNML
ncbi:MAG: hypothetical protein JXA37_14005 [Chloroflexia bacterium]|nr:hypothetical protein [Chloroflexia bacterium]